MGWSSGTDIFDDVMDTVLERVTDEDARRAIAVTLAEKLWEGDWDTEDESVYFHDYLEPLMIERGFITADDI